MGKGREKRDLKSAKREIAQMKGAKDGQIAH